jgi:colanic acid/amylovoran biosynthesis glycosyltransferase
VNLILFSASFPFVRGNEASFLGIEVQHLVKAFDHVLVVPEEIKNPTPVEVAGIEVDTSYSKMIAAAGNTELAQLALSSPIFYQGMMENSFPRFSYPAWRRLIAFSGKAELTRRWVLDFFHSKKNNPHDSLFYTYWFYHAVTGIAFARREYSEIRLVTRAHGYDIFAEEYYQPSFFPCRTTTFPAVDRVFPDSEAGTDYFKKAYPEFLQHIETSLLGVADPGFINQPSRDNVFRIISCSMIRPEKRVELILDAVKQAAIMRPTQHFEWIHVGNGDLREEFQERAIKEFPLNAKTNFPGYSDHETLMEMYKKTPFDLFVNLSETEGTPVSIMEAISCGIPILATAVGGNKEIVSTQNGILVSEDPTPDEVASKFFFLIDHADEMRDMRNGSREVWETHYNAQRNFSEFSQALRSLRLNA